jgi:hypothetical protein
MIDFADYSSRVAWWTPSRVVIVATRVDARVSRAFSRVLRIEELALVGLATTFSLVLTDRPVCHFFRLCRPGVLIDPIHPSLTLPSAIRRTRDQPERQLD